MSEAHKLEIAPEQRSACISPSRFPGELFERVTLQTPRELMLTGPDQWSWLDYILSRRSQRHPWD